MYKELKKFATGEKSDGIVVLTDKQEIKVTYDKYQANLGDLIDDFIEHKTKPFWKRKHYHGHLTRIYKDMLNKINVVHGL